ncbi:MAG: GGDEF domain-containing protein [Candidatus Sphingomonas phytovorans]|nr:GGDEF domain-containing protein [Sphingomonas sp.]WEJ97888.1 MAG: GGDEF domain-containing protein [Sphingomonas sp.]
MNGAVFALAVNAGMALLFAASFAVIALSYRAQRSALWFCAGFAMGALTPVSELLVRFSDVPDPFVVTSYATFLASLLLMTAGLQSFHGQRRAWGVIATLFLLGMALRATIWGGARNTIAYELVFQVPFAIAALLASLTAFRVGRSKPLYLILSASYGLIALHFATKPFFAVAFGSGRTAQEYSTSTYALFSQACTGILMVGTGLLLLLLVVQKAVAQSQLDAETDPLSDIANRRGFDRQAQQAFARADRLGRPLSAVMFDLDHFKAINDTHGHDVGDQVIAAFAGLLQRAAPQSAIVARIGGEEFAMLLERTTAESACLSAQAIRVATADLTTGGLPPVTVSGGVAERREGDSLADLMRRADRASYRAKEEGRNRICIARDLIEPALGQNVVTLNVRRA